MHISLLSFKHNRGWCFFSKKNIFFFNPAVQVSPNSLGDGMVIHTDRGEMIAHNLSSVAEFKQTGPNGQKTTLQNIASICGSVVCMQKM